MSQLRGFLARPGRGAPAPAWKRRWLWRTGPCIETPVGRGALAPCIETPETFLRIAPPQHRNTRPDAVRTGSASLPLRLSPSVPVRPRPRPSDPPYGLAPRKRRPDNSSGRRRAQKKGELLASHRYNHIPLLDSSPGGVCGSWSYKTYPSTKVRIFCIFAKKKGTICDFVAVFREPDAEKAAWMCLGGRCGES